MGEIWKPIDGTEYEASDLGRVRRVVILNPSLAKSNSYLKVRHRRGTKMLTRLVHQCVTEAFLGPIPNGFVVNHKDGNKLNNTIENLEYVSGAVNSKLAAQSGLYHSGQKHYRAKLTSREVSTAREMYETGKFTFQMLSVHFGVSKATINKAVRGKTYGLSVRN